MSANQGKTLKDKVDLKANDSDVVKKTDITTTIDKTSTNDKVPSASAIYNKSQNKIADLPNGTDIIAYADSISNEAVADTVRIMNASNSPYKAVGIGSDFHYTIYNIDDDGYKRIVAYDIRKNDMYMILKHSGTWGTWQRVCTTRVADVPKTTVTTTVPSGIVAGSGGAYVEYVVKNGWCNAVYMFNIVSSTIIPWTKIATGLPKPAISNVNAILINEDGELKRIATRIRTDENLYLSINEPISEAGWWMGAVTYPVA